VGSDFPKENVDILGSDNRIELSYQMIFQRKISRDKDKQEYIEYIGVEKK